MYISTIKENEYRERIVETEAYLSKKANVGSFRSFDGAELAYEYYLTNPCRSSIIIIHGFTEFAKKYREMCWYFLNSGYNVFVFDQRGHGLSHRDVAPLQLTHIDRFSDYADDLKEFINKVVSPASGDIPLFIYSHSMGGAITLDFLERNPGKIAKAVLSAPMLCPTTRGVPRKVLRKIVETQAKKDGWRARFKHSGEFNPAPEFERTSDMSRARFEYHMQSRLAEEKYQTSAATNRWMYEALSLIDTVGAKRNVSEISSEILVFSAEKDKVVRNRPQRILASWLPKSRHIFVKDAKHNLHSSSDEILQQYMNNILEFFSN